MQVWSNFENSIYTINMNPIKKYFIYLRLYHQLSRQEIHAICLPYQREWALSNPYKSITELQAYGRGFASKYRQIYAQRKMAMLELDL
jgi:hypothetical protein